MLNITILETLIAMLMLINALIALSKAIKALKRNHTLALLLNSMLAFAYLVFPAIVLWPDFLPPSWKVILEVCIMIVLICSLYVNIKRGRT